MKLTKGYPTDWDIVYVGPDPDHRESVTLTHGVTVTLAVGECVCLRSVMHADARAFAGALS